ncbi:signal peptide protein [Kitasatospora sp. NBC_01250]|uniref:signal peptide protein n=1 Tax=unclassified Kitasatospora TaxID=2633591 RepID=UPI002E0D35A2|nr:MULTISPECIES: signal peptide protein [unclassified Kitasatospora]WSJ65052.1 signal peptide protein [Kitasatospora sp. NBC_01302]
MLTKRNRLGVTAAAAVTVAAAVVSTGPAMAAAPPTAVASAASDRFPVAPTDFVNLPASPLATGHQTLGYTVTYRNTTSTDQIVAPQLLVLSPDAGPFLQPSDVQVQQLTGSGQWRTVQLGTQTGTLYTNLTRAKERLHSGETLVQHYRLTVITTGAVGTVAPRVALYS